MDIKLKDILQDSSAVFGVTDENVCILYHFFKKHSSSDVYYIDDSEELISPELQALLGAYGIIINNTTNLDAIERQFIIIPYEVLSDKNSLQNYLLLYRDTRLQPGYCVIEHDYSDESINNEDFQMVRLLLPDCFIMNSTLKEANNLLTAEKARQNISNSINPITHNKYELVEISDLFKGIGLIDNVNIYVQKVLCIVDTIVGRNYDSDTILYTTELSNNDIHVYLAVAAYMLIQYNIKFQINPINHAEFLDIMRSAKRKEYLFIDDYLRGIQNFSDFSILPTEDCCYLYVKDYNKLSNIAIKDKYSPLITMFRAPIAIDSWSLLQDFSKQSLVVHLNKIHGIKRLKELCDICSSDFDIAMGSFEKLNTLVCKAMESLIKQKIIINHDSLTLDNMLIYEQGGTFYLAYVVNISGNLPFFVYPLSPGYKPFTTDVTIADLDRLLDSRIFFDAETYCAKLRAVDKRYGSAAFNYDSDTIRGIILKGFKANKFMFSKDNPLTIAEIGVWSFHTSSSRTVYKDSFSTIFSNKALLENKYYTFFGFMHPSRSNTIYVKNDFWRYDNVNY